MTTEVAEGTLKFYVEHLTSRIDKHSIEQKDGFEKMADIIGGVRDELVKIKLAQAQERLDTYKQIAEVRKEVAAVKESATTANNGLALKIASMTGNVGTIYAIIQLLIKFAPH